MGISEFRIGQYVQWGNMAICMLICCLIDYVLWIACLDHPFQPLFPLSLPLFDRYSTVKNGVGLWSGEGEGEGEGLTGNNEFNGLIVNVIFVNNF